MELTHPQGSYQDVPAENVFIAQDEMGTQMGVGFVVWQYLPHFCPEVPINMYFEINSQPSGWYMLFGALVARARQLRESNPGVNARMYTRLSPEDGASLALYEHNALNCRQFASQVRIWKPEGPGRVPMACTVVSTPVNTPEEQQQLIARLQQNDITTIDVPYLQRMMTTPHFCLLTMLHGNVRVGEALFWGEGSSCELAAVYTSPMYRRQGMAKMLIHRGMAMLMEEGVEEFTACFSSLSAAQIHLAQAFRAADIRLQCLYPELLL